MSRYVAPYYPTPDHIVDRMLRVASVGPGDVVFDLGCGDGKVRGGSGWLVQRTRWLLGNSTVCTVIMALVEQRKR